MEELTAIGLRPGFFVPLICIAVIAAIAAVLIYKGRKGIPRNERDSLDDGSLWRQGGYMLGSMGVALATVTALTFIPFQWHYAPIYRVTGEVTNVSNVIADATGKLTTAPIVELDTLPVSVALNNERAVGLEGKTVTLTCTVNWHYAAADRLECDIYEIK